MLANYHTHTVRCFHAHGHDREYVEAAIKAGMTDLGFADHVPYIYPDKKYQEGTKMLISDVEGYFESLLTLRKEYSEKIRIHIGFEAEYYESCFEQTFNKLTQYPLDFLILGQHRIDDYTSRSSFSATDKEKHLETYVETVIKAISTGKFSYIAHPDVINFTGDDKIFYKHMKRLCLAAKQHDVPLEINMAGANLYRNYPSARFFKIAAETGNDVIIGADAHGPENMIVENGINRCYEIMNKFGIKPITYLKFKAF